MTVVIDLTDKAFLASLPRPTGGELIADYENYAIHGVALIGLQSRNDGAKFDLSAKKDIERLINESPNPTTVQFGHFQKSTFEENGGIVNAYLDGNVLRGSHFLNPHEPSSEKLLYNAKHFKANQCYSVEAWESDLIYKETGSGRSIVGAKDIKWFAVDRSCGTTHGMNQSLIREEGNKMAARNTRPTKPEQIKTRYPDLYQMIVDQTRAEALAEVKDQETHGELESLSEKVSELEKSLADKQSEIDKLIAENESRLRKDDILEQWRDLIKDVDLTLLPKTEEGKIILALGEISEEELNEFATKDEAETTKVLQIRLATIKNNLVLAETYREKKPSFVDVKSDKTTVAAGIDLGGIKFGG